MSFWTRLADTITPWDRQGEAQRRRKREEENAQSQIQSQSRNTSGSAPSGQASSLRVVQPSQNIPIQAQGFDVGLDTKVEQNVNVPSKSEYDYGLEKPKQSFWNKVRDQFDANTEADQYRRLTRDASSIRKDLIDRGVNPSKANETSVKIAKSTAQPAHRSGFDTLRETAMGTVRGVPVVIPTAARILTGAVEGISDIPSLAMHGGDWALNKATGNTGNSRITKGYDRLNQQLKRPLGAINRGIDNSTDFFGGKNSKAAYQVGQVGGNVLLAATGIGAASQAANASKAARVAQLSEDLSNPAIRQILNVGKGDDIMQALRAYRGVQSLPSAYNASNTSRILGEVGSQLHNPLINKFNAPIKSSRELINRLRGVEDVSGSTAGGNIVNATEDVLSDAEIEDILKETKVAIDAAESTSQPINVRTPDADRPIIRELAGDAPNVTQVPTRTQAAEQRAANRFQKQDFGRPDERIEGVTPRTPEQPYQYDAEIAATTQDKLVDEYAEFLRSIGEGNGTQLVPDGEGGYIRTSNNVRFGDTKGKRMTKDMWREEAERQLRTGKADPAIQREFDDATNPEIQSLLARGEQAPVEEGRPIKVQQVDSIPVQDRTDVPQGLPEKPGTVRATTSNAPAKTQAEAVAAAQPPTPPTKDLPKSEYDKFGDKAKPINDDTNEIIKRADDGDFSGAKSGVDRLIEDPEYAAKTKRAAAIRERVAKLNEYIKKKEAAAEAKDLPKSEFDEGPLPTTQADTPSALPKSDADFNRQMFIDQTGGDLQRATRALRDLKKVRKGENSARFARADKAREAVQRAGGTFEEAEAAYYNALGGQLSKAGYEGSGFDFNTPQGKRLLSSIDKLTEGRPADRGNLRRSFNRLFNYGQEGVDTLQPNDVKRIRAFYNQVIPDEQLGDGIEQAIRELDELDKAEPGNIKKFLGLQRALLFTADVGSMLRQSLGAGVRHPKMWAESVSDGFKALASPQKFEEMRRFLETDRVANYAKERGLDLTMMGKGAGEEQFRNAEWAQRIPGVGKVVDASQRFFDAQTNMLRYKNFKKFVDSAGGIGKLERAGGDNPDQFVGAIVNVVNTNTGRGTFGKLGSPEAGWLNEVFNSPKGLAARINRVNPKYYVDLARTNPAAAKEALSSLVIQSGLTAAILGTAAANGNYEDGKIKVGNTRYDITGGTATMFSTLKDMSDAFTGSGDTSPWKNAGTELDQWFKNQLTPAINTTYDLITSIPQDGTKFTDFKRQDLYGNEITPMSFLIDSFLPLGAQGVIEDLTENDTSPVQTGVNALTNAVGIGTNTYETADDKDNASRAETADQVNSELQKIAGTGLLSEQMIADIDDEDVRDILTGKSDKQLSEDELKKVRNKLVEGIGTGTGGDSDTAYRERGEYDKDLAALRLKKEMLEAEPNAKPSDIKGLEVQIKRSELLRDNDISFELLEKYQKTGVEDWRKLGEDDPKMFQKLWEIDELMAKAGVSYKSGSFTDNKYYQKEGKSGGRGGRGGRKLSTDFGKLTGTSPFAPKVREYVSLDQSTGRIPRIKRTNPNIVHTIREGRV